MAENNDYKTINVLGDVYYTTYTKKYEARQKWEKADPKKVFSFIPGTILEIAVKAGDSVNEGDVLYVFEAMKMSNTVNSPLTGKIKSVNISVGENIPKGTLVIEFE